MTLGIFLAMGDSFKNMAKTGQDIQFKKFYLARFSQEFSQIYIFSYEGEKVQNLPSNIRIIPNKYALHRYLYGLVLPFLNLAYIKKCDVFRSYHLSGTIPAIITKLFFLKPFVFNYAYNYSQFAKIENKKLLSLLIRLFEPLALIFASKIFAANKNILKKFISPKAVYLPNGVDTNFFKPATRAANKKPLILSVGRLEKQKNFELLIYALLRINANLLIVGKGSLKSKLLSLSFKLGVNLKIIERINYFKMPKIYNQADIFILPSIAEGHPKVLLEAMACALPSIGSKIPGILDIIKNNKNGLLVNPNQDEIARSIERLIKDNNLRQKLSKAARRFVESHYDLKKLLSLEINIIKGT